MAGMILCVVTPILDRGQNSLTSDVSSTVSCSNSLLYILEPLLVRFCYANKWIQHVLIDQNDNSKTLFLTHITWRLQVKLCSRSTTNLRHISSHSEYQDERADPLYNMLLLVAGSFCLDAAYILFAHVLMAKASHKADIPNGAYRRHCKWCDKGSKCVFLLGVERNQRAMINITIYHRTIQVGDMRNIIKNLPSREQL